MQGRSVRSAATAVAISVCASLLVFAPSVAAAQTVRVSVASDGREARGGSWVHEGTAAVSADGTVVVFSSPVVGLVPDDTDARRDVFAWQNGTTTRMVPPGITLTSDILNPDVSADGRIVVFQTRDIGLNPGGIFNHEQVYAWNRQTGAIDRVSLGHGGVQPNGSSERAAVSSDGRYVAFLSLATNLTASAPPTGRYHGYRYDRVTGQTTLVTSAANTPDVEAPNVLDVSVDGDVAYNACPTLHLPPARCSVMVYDGSTGLTEEVSTDSADVPLPSGVRPLDVSISDDGRYLVFTAAGRPMIGPETVVVKDRLTRRLRFVIPPMPWLTYPSEGLYGRISGDGRYVVYRAVPYLTGTDFTPVHQVGIYRADLSAPEEAPPPVKIGVPSSVPFITTTPYGVASDGTVVFLSDLAGLTPDDDNGNTDVFTSTGAGQVTRLTRSNASSAVSAAPAISYDGSVVAFISSATTLVPDFQEPRAQVYVRDLARGTTTRIPATGVQAGGHAAAVDISHDGRWVAFAQSAVAWLHDRQSGETEAVSGAAIVLQVALSADGRHVAFMTATPLVAHDVNGRADVYVYDRFTRSTRRVEGLADHEATPIGSLSISADARIVGFTGTRVVTFDGQTTVGTGFFVHNRDVSRDGVFDQPGDVATGSADWLPLIHALGGTVSADGNVFVETRVESYSATAHTIVGRTDFSIHLGVPGTFPAGSYRHDFAQEAPSISADGRIVAYRSLTPVTNGDTNGQMDVHAAVMDPVTVTVVSVERISVPSAGGVATGGPVDGTGNPAVSGNGRHVAFDSGFTSLVADDTNRTWDVFLRTSPTLPAVSEPAPGYDTWLTTQRRPADVEAGSPWSDPDGDGVPTIEEFRGGGDGKPFVGLFRRYFAEGATDTGGLAFITRFALANPGPDEVDVRMEYRMPEGRTAAPATFTLGPWQRMTVTANDNVELAAAAFGTSVLSSSPIGVERTMVWGAGQYAGHADSGVAEPGLRWYFAEGATIAGFQLFYLLQNPSEAGASLVEARYLLAGGGVRTKEYVVPAGSRLNIWANEDLFDPSGVRELANREFSAEFRVVSGPAIVAERAMYRSLGGRPFKAGHVSAGAPAAATEWFLAEGNAGDFFDYYVLIANPSNTHAQLDIDLLLTDGRVLRRTMTVSANSRTTLWVDEIEEPVGSWLFPFRTGATDLSLRVRATNGVPVVVERAMWWPGDASSWYEAHSSLGATTTAARWVVADGEVGGAIGWDTYVLVANTGIVSGTFSVTLLVEGQAAPLAAGTLTVPAHSRTTLSLAQLLAGQGLAEGRAAVVIAPVGAPMPLVVERAMYASRDGRLFEVGMNGLATPLP